MSAREQLFESMFDIAEKYDINLTNSPDMRPGVPEIGDFCGDIESAVLAAGYVKVSEAEIERAENAVYSLAAINAPEVVRAVVAALREEA